MACHPYPENMPLECATQLWAMLRDDISNTAQKHQIIHHAWTIIGYGAKLYESTSPDTPTPFGCGEDQTKFTEALRGCKDCCDKQRQVFGNDILDFFSSVLQMLDQALHWLLEKLEAIDQ